MNAIDKCQDITASPNKVLDCGSNLGRILVDAGVISEDVLDLALQLSSGLGIFLGQVLVDAGRISENDLANALLAQKMVRGGVLDADIASRAVGLCHRSRLAFSDAVARASWFLLGQNPKVA